MKFTIKLYHGMHNNKEIKNNILKYIYINTSTKYERLDIRNDITKIQL